MKVSEREVVQAYMKTGTIAATAREMQIDRKTAAAVLKRNGIVIQNREQHLANTMGNAVIQYDMNGNVIRSYPSAKLAARALGNMYDEGRGASGHITDCCRGKRKSAYGYVWKFGEGAVDHGANESQKFDAMKRIQQFTKDGELINEFESAKEAVKHLGHGCTICIQDVCRGTQKTAYGFVWKYAS